MPSRIKGEIQNPLIPTGNGDKVYAYNNNWLKIVGNTPELSDVMYLKVSSGL